MIRKKGRSIHWQTPPLEPEECRATEERNFADAGFEPGTY